MKRFNLPVKLNKKTILCCIILILSLSTLISIKFFLPLSKDATYTEFKDQLNKRQIESVEIILSSDTFTYTLFNGERRKTQNPKYDNFKKDLLDNGVNVKEKKGPINITSFISIFLYLLFIAVVLYYIKISRGDDSFLKITQKSTGNNSDITFKDVAGLHEVKADLMTIVDFLKDPTKYKSAGADLPKGAIFYGPPGTGKTLLARAVAGEANVKFRATSGSDFVEKYVGVGASRVRQLFKWASENAPCIIFIDEIDAIGASRTASEQEKRQTLNALLSEMDGFKAGEGVVVIAATNKFEELDSALIRPGRFDNHFAIPLPVSTAERKEVIDIYSKNKKFSNVNLDVFAKETLGFSPADIQVVLNEAAIIAARDNNGYITKEILDKALYKKLMKGHAKVNPDRKAEEIKLTAWHEAGHALACILLGQEVTKVTIVPSTSGAGGATFHNQKKLGMYTKNELYDRLAILYGGRAAESILVGPDKITTGASSDIQEATKLIRSMVCEYGMSELGLLAINELDKNSQPIVYDICKEISRESYYSAYNLLEANSKSLEKIAEALIEKATITGDEIKKLINV